MLPLQWLPPLLCFHCNVQCTLLVQPTMLCTAFYIAPNVLVQLTMLPLHCILYITHYTLHIALTLHRANFARELLWSTAESNALKTAESHLQV